MKTILTVDDDEYINNMLYRALTNEGYNVIQAFSGTEALMIIEKTVPDLILLDLMLPGISGEKLIKKIKDIPVIVVSAKVDVDSKVDLLLGGAVDYITKPFELKELIARIKLRLQASQKAEKSSNIIIGDVKIDTLLVCVTVCNNEIKLTKTEYAILKVLMKNSPNVVTKSALLDELSFETPDCVESSLKVHISNLRKKLREYSEKEYIENVWGIGFKFTES